ncbi:MAG: sigma 54-interacting transcriptional regulator, partial [Deltaproteobacteria bacterium]|nr:sigma 54-interacting transcriptional regulator [Deltaproteobacteria bacterium]
MKAEILIVDDEENIRFTLEKFLLAEGYEVTTAESYNEALCRINEADFDLIFTDIILDGKTGIDLLKEIKRRNLQSPVVMFTGVPDIETASSAVRLGGYDYLPKPLRQNTLVRVAKMALRHKALIDEKEKYRLNLEAIFKSVKDAIITVDQNLSIIEVNNAAKTLCGISKKKAIGKKFHALTRDCNGKCLEILEETIMKKESLEIHRFECHCKHRSNQVVNLTTYPFLDHRDILSGGILIIRDETQLVDLERNLKERYQFHNIIGRNPKMQEIYSLIEDLADLQTTVLITGESGTGKELIANALHCKGIRNDKLLVKVNCAALSDNLLESELFGHVKGAFTGAVKDKTGRFQKAHQGTIFLDEIGEMSHRMQVRLLRVLQEMEFERVGDS